MKRIAHRLRGKEFPFALRTLSSSPGSPFCGLHHGLLHAVFTGPIQADFVAIGVIEIGVPPAPRHQARQLRDVKALLLKLPAKAVEIADLEVQSEEHTSELQSLRHLVCRLLLE